MKTQVVKALCGTELNCKWEGRLAKFKEVKSEVAEVMRAGKDVAIVMKGKEEG